MAQRQLSLFLILFALCLGVWGYILHFNIHDRNGRPLLPWALRPYGLILLYGAVVIIVITFIQILYNWNKSRILNTV